VTDYLRLQARYAHLFRPVERTETIARIQAIADRNISRFGLRAGNQANQDQQNPGAERTLASASDVRDLTEGR
jgi:pyruvate ferredoxin oxidoreductase beta subunit